MIHGAPGLRRRAITVALLALAASIAGCNRSQKDSPLDDSSPKLTMRTHCVGRFLIDLPNEFKQTNTSDAELFYGLGKDYRTVNVQAVELKDSEPSTESLVKKRVAELVAQDHLKSPSKNMLAGQRKIDEETTLIRAYDSPDMLEYLKVELFAKRGEAVGRFRDDVYKTDRPDDIEARLLQIAQRTKAQGKLPQDRGTCLDPLVIDAGQDGEALRVSFRAERWPAVVIQLRTNSMPAKSDGGLLSRWNRNSGMLGKLDFKSNTLRSGKVTIANMAAEELLSKGEERGLVVRGFAAETLLTKPATLSEPWLALSLDMGGQTESGEYRAAPWSDDESTAIWDAVTKSLRLRPGAQ